MSRCQAMTDRGARCRRSATVECEEEWDEYRPPHTHALRAPGKFHPCAGTVNLCRTHDLIHRRRDDSTRWQRDSLFYEEDDG